MEFLGDFLHSSRTALPLYEPIGIPLSCDTCMANNDVRSVVTSLKRMNMLARG